MATITVSPIQRYNPSTAWFDLSKYNNLGVQERVAVDLARSNLWLIDSSQLQLIEDYAPRIAFLNEGAGYQSPVVLSASGTTTGQVTVFPNLSGYNSVMPNSSGPLWRGDWVQLSTLSAGTQIDLSVIPNGVSNRTATPLSTDPSLNPTSSFNPNSPIFWVAYADPKATRPIILLGYEDWLGRGSDNDFNDGVLALDLGETNFQWLFNNTNLGQNAKVNLATAKPVPVPFDASPSLGLLLLGLLFYRRWCKWFRWLHEINWPIDRERSARLR